VKFKIDENLPVKLPIFCTLLIMMRQPSINRRSAVKPICVSREVCLAEGRVLVTLDLDFSDVHIYPPDRYPGFMVLRVLRQDKPHVMDVFRQAIALLQTETVEHRLWIVEETRVRIRGEEG
jgi:predicted nuclease of predicted toxin-antitoxin system